MLSRRRRRLLSRTDDDQRPSKLPSEVWTVACSIAAVNEFCGSVSDSVLLWLQPSTPTLCDKLGFACHLTSRIPELSTETNRSISNIMQSTGLVDRLTHSVH